MPGWMHLDKGSKRRVRQLRWTRWTLSERVSLAMVLTVVVVETICLAWWLMTHSFD